MRSRHIVIAALGVGLIAAAAAPLALSGSGVGPILGGWEADAQIGPRPPFGRRPPPPRGEGGFLSALFGGGRGGPEAGGPPAGGGWFGGPPTRRHTATEAEPLDLARATEDPIAFSRISISVRGGERLIVANGLSDHDTGRFPNRGNPNTIEEQSFEIRLPVDPVFTGRPRRAGPGGIGIAINGVVFEPTAAEWYLGERRGDWNYDALGGAVPLGLDEHFAHVQPDGTYHYHGAPSGLLESLGVAPDSPSPIVGWAFDGFPIYAFYAPDGADGAIEMQSSYRLRDGRRPSGDGDPGGFYDGAFVEDYEYVAGLGHLDQCNGAFVITSDFPDGTYAYFITESFPVLPRCLMGEQAYFRRRR